MYNTVGETAGVTQDVGSDPTVSGFDFFCEGWYCMFCGKMVVGEEEGEEEEEEGEEQEKEKVKVVNLVMIGSAEMSRLEDEDMDMDMNMDENGEVDDDFSSVEQKRLADDDVK